jgi:hypothetical protein
MPVPARFTRRAAAGASIRACAIAAAFDEGVSIRFIGIDGAIGQYDAALIGTTETDGATVPVYDEDLLIELMACEFLDDPEGDIYAAPDDDEDGQSAHQAAVDFFNKNTLGSLPYLDHPPVIVSRVCGLCECPAYECGCDHDEEIADLLARVGAQQAAEGAAAAG